MSRERKIEALTLNLRLHPHSKDIYRNYLQEIFELRTPVNIHGNRYAVISSLKTEQTNSDIIRGVISTFTKIEFDGDWFDSNKMSDASVERLEEITIPESLHPNLSTFYFIFNIKTHKLLVQIYSKGKRISSRQILQFFLSLSKTPQIEALFGATTITIEQCKDGLESLFSLQKITRIQIILQKPNADILQDDFEEKIENHLLQTNSRKLSYTYTAETGQSISPDDDIKRASSAALTNGEVKVSGRDENGAVARSTLDMPKVLSRKFNPETSGEYTAFEQMANDLDNE